MSRRSRERANARPWEGPIASEKCKTCVHLQTPWDYDWHCGLFVSSPVFECEHHTTDEDVRKVVMMERCPDTGDMFEDEQEGGEDEAN